MVYIEVILLNSFHFSLSLRSTRGVRSSRQADLEADILLHDIRRYLAEFALAFIVKGAQDVLLNM